MNRSWLDDGDVCDSHISESRLVEQLRFQFGVR
jgi:hypothetical protein